MQLTIDSAIFLGFLLINLIVGLSYGRGVKTIRDYALGGRNFSTAALVATIVATSVTGSGFVVDLSNTYSQGLPYIIASLSWCLQFVIIAVFLVPRMSEFMGALSVAEIMGNLYNPRVRIITAICGILLHIGLIAVEFKVFGIIVHHLLGISPTLSIIIAALIVVIYSSFGGARAITYTDMLQFFTFGFAIPMLGLIIWGKFQFLHLSLDNAWNNPLFDYRELLNLRGTELYSLLFLIVYFAVPAIEPVHFQRISMGRSIKQVQTAFAIAIAIFLITALAEAWIPFLIANIEPGLKEDEIMGYIFNNYTYAGFRGLLIIGITALAMSSADSLINGSAVFFAHDLKEGFNIRNVNSLAISKLFAFIVGGFAIYLALYTDDLLTMIKNAASVYMPVVTVPLIFSILGFRSSAKSVLYGMSAGLITVLVLILLKVDEVILPSMLVNVIFLFGAHYFLKQPGGWVGVKDNDYLIESKNKRKRWVSKIIKSLTISSFINFCRRTAPKNEMMYTWLGIYCIFFTISTMYSTQAALKGANGQIILTIYQIMMCTGVVTAMYPIWPARIKGQIIMQLAWNIIIFYMLVFFSCFFVMLSNFGQLQFVIFTVNIILTATLVGWRLSLGMMAAGFYLSVLFYKYYAGIDNLNISIGSPGFIFMYSLILIGGALVICLKPKQDESQLIEERHDHLKTVLEDAKRELILAKELKSEFIRNVSHEYNTPLTAVISTVQLLKKAYHRLNEGLILEALEDIYKNSLKIEGFANNIDLLSKLSRSSFDLVRKPFNFSNLVHERLETCKKLYIDESNEENRRFVMNIKDDIMYNGDENYIAKVLDNIVINAITYCPGGTIAVNLMKSKHNIHCSIKDSGIGIPKEELYDIFSEFVVGSKTKTPAGGRGLGLALCKKIVEIHGGEIWAESDGKEGARFAMRLPVDVA
jgi:Na+/proline symporter/signal transduction histidine kinase